MKLFIHDNGFKVKTGFFPFHHFISHQITSHHEQDIYNHYLIKMYTFFYWICFFVIFWHIRTSYRLYQFSNSKWLYFFCNASNHQWMMTAQKYSFIIIYSCIYQRVKYGETIHYWISSLYLQGKAVEWPID